MESPNRPTAPSASGAVSLSCQLCRKRKIKCDKQTPCSNCVTAQKECVPVVRARLPRGRNGGRKAINAELRNRINRLEGLVQSLNSGLLPDDRNIEVAAEKGRTNSEPQISNFSGQNFPRQSNKPELHEVAGDTTRWLGSTLWSQLAHELTGLHSVLEAEDDDDNHDYIDSNSPSMTTDSSGTPKDSILFNSQPIPILSPHNLSDNEMLECFKIFRRNVDYAIKFVHMPSFEKLLIAKEPYLGYSADSMATQALMSAAFYACICSISNSHCLSSFGKTKQVLREEWQHAAFQCLAKVEIVKTPSLVSLQALMLYIAALRSHQNDQQSWMLCSLAVRTAQALQLHREESYHVLPWGRAEIHRRAWYSMIALDYQAAMDRGSDLMIPDAGWTTKPPSPSVDTEFLLDSSAPLTHTGPCQSMMFYAIHCQSNWLLRQLNWILPGEAERPPTPMQSSWRVRQDAIMNLQRNLEENILAYCAEDNVLKYACMSFTKVLIKCGQLYAVRPLQRHPALTVPPPEHLNIMLLAVEALVEKRGLMGESTEPWHWIIKGYVDWHSLAVLLAELCNADQYDPQLVERGWNIANIAFEGLSEQIAEGTQGPLWKPMKKLMRSAQRKRDGFPAVPVATTKPEPSTNTMDILSTYTDTAMDLTAMNQPLAANTVGDQDWNNAMLDPLQASWFNWQAFTDDLTQSNWGGMTFDSILENL